MIAETYKVLGDEFLLRDERADKFLINIFSTSNHWEDKNLKTLNFQLIIVIEDVVFSIEFLSGIMAIQGYIRNFVRATKEKAYGRFTKQTFVCT